MESASDGTKKDSMVRSHLFLRKTLGWLGIGLPFALLFGGIIFGTVPQNSISHYFHTNMGSVFVGVIVAYGLFLITYTGYHKYDNLLGNFAGFCALFIIIFPTTPQNATPLEKIHGALHFTAATFFFLSLIVFCVHFFRKTHKDKDPTPEKEKRNNWYLGCGIIMGLNLALIVTHKWLNFPSYEKSVFWLEAFALVAFGIAWLIKGKFILADSGDDEAVF